MLKKPKSILIIEDDQTLANNLKELIELKDYKAYVCNTIIDASELLKVFSPDLIISDIIMPDFDGYTLLNKIKNDPKLKFVPFVFISGKAEVKDIRLGMNMGADDYLTKPFSAKDLYDTIEMRIAKSEQMVEQMKFVKLSNDDDQTGIFTLEMFKNLSKSEQKIVVMVAENKTSEDIARELGISKKTVENHRYNLAKKLEVNGKLSLLRFCLNNAERLISFSLPDNQYLRNF